MHLIQSYQQTGIFDPTDPNQRIREGYAGLPGQWTSYYWDRVNNGSQLQGLRGGLAAPFSTWPSWMQIGVVGAAATAVGYFVMARWGSKIRPTLTKIPIVGGALAGHRRRRR